MWLVATCLIVFGLVLWAADRRGATAGEATSRGMADLSFGNAVVLGMAQGLAFQPGVSRSGVTLSVARSLRVERTEAARLVFLMSLPVIAGAGLLSAVDVTVPAGWWPPFLAGMAAAGGRAEWIFAPVVIVSDNAMVKARMDGTAQIQVEAGEQPEVWRPARRGARQLLQVLGAG